MLLPVLLLLVGVAIDFARVYQGWVTLESATRDAAQYLATSNFDQYADDYTVPNAVANNLRPNGGIGNDGKAQTVLLAETGKTFTSSGSATLGSCATPTMTTITSALDTTAASGGSAANPVQQVRVLACMPFRTLFSYPFFTSNGNWILSSDRTYKLIVGR